MTVNDMCMYFEKHNTEYSEFDRIKKPITKRPDLYAFLMLENLCPSNVGIIAGAEHDEIFIDVDLDRLAEVITEQDIINLIRCSVRLEELGLCMFV